MSVIFLVLTTLMALVIYFDAAEYKIPNWLVGLLLAVWPVMFLLSGGNVPWMSDLLTMLAVFAVGYVIFAMRWMGGGDIKLLTACALFVGFPRISDFLIMMALFGGGLAIVLIALRKGIPLLLPKLAGSARLPRLLQDGQAVPYGLAIAAAFLILLWQQQLPGLTLTLH